MAFLPARPCEKCLHEPHSRRIPPSVPTFTFLIRARLDSSGRCNSKKKSGARPSRVLGGRLGILTPLASYKKSKSPSCLARTARRGRGTRLLNDYIQLYCCAPPADAVVFPIASPDSTSSTRRFCCLPSAVSLVAIGWVLPKPRASTELAAIPCCTR